jgi:hypothetical protein
MHQLKLDPPQLSPMPMYENFWVLVLEKSKVAEDSEDVD